MIISKFGGTSVADATAIRRTADIIKGRLDRQPVVVVSALAGATNALIAIAELAAAGRTFSSDTDTATNSNVPPVSSISPRTRNGYAGMKAHAFSVTCPAVSIGSVDGYPLVAITRYQAPSQIDANDRYFGCCSVNEFAAWMLAKPIMSMPVTIRAST